MVSGRGGLVLKTSKEELTGLEVGELRNSCRQPSERARALEVVESATNSRGSQRVLVGRMRERNFADHENVCVWLREIGTDKCSQ